MRCYAGSVYTADHEYICPVWQISIMNWGSMILSDVCNIRRAQHTALHSTRTAAIHSQPPTCISGRYYRFVFDVGCPRPVHVGVSCPVQHLGGEQLFIGSSLFLFCPPLLRLPRHTWPGPETAVRQPCIKHVFRVGWRQLGGPCVGKPEVTRGLPGGCYNPLQRRAETARPVVFLLRPGEAWGL